ncbi:MAG: hypothetical protein IMZ57_11880 [Acidobacteria bacterium]|nr:hypothetical protein [Acidobacteriota bacterium]
MRIRKPTSGHVAERIRESRRKFTQGEIRGELLKRSVAFKDEFAKVQDLIIKEFLIPNGDEWQDFCRRWRISEDWNGDMGILAERTHALPSVHISIPFSRLSKTQPDLKSFTIYPLIGDPWHGIGEALHDSIAREDGYLLVRIHPWTSKKDLEFIWTEIQVAQKKVFGDPLNEREKRTFARDLCWYDLHDPAGQFKLSLGQIRDQQKPTSRVVIQKAIERIEKEIDRLTPSRV